MTYTIQLSSGETLVLPFVAATTPDPGGGGGGDAANWGDIGGTLADQTDLQTALTDRALTTRTVSAGSGLTGGGSLVADRTISLSTANVDKLAAISVAAETLTLDRSLILGLYDHTIAAGLTDAPPSGSIFRSTVNGLVYHRLADGTTRLLDNETSEYGGGGAGSVEPVSMSFASGEHLTHFPDTLSGDVLVAVLRAYDAGGASVPSLPSGWTSRHTRVQGNLAVRVISLACDGTETGALGFTHAGIVLLRNAGTIVVGSASDDAASLAFPLTTAGADGAFYLSWATAVDLTLSPNPQGFFVQPYHVEITDVWCQYAQFALRKGRFVNPIVATAASTQPMITLSVCAERS